jgi:hypothetical protein
LLRRPRLRAATSRDRDAADTPFFLPTTGTLFARNGTTTGGYRPPFHTRRQDIDMKGHFRIAALFAILTTFGAARADVFQLNYEAPGMQTSTATFSVTGVETFDEQPVGVNSGFSTDFGTGGAITGIYGGTNGIPIDAANAFGGAGGSGRYAVAYENPNAGGSESDNQTVGLHTETGGVAAPESSTYLMIVTGTVGLAALGGARRPRPSRYAIDADFEPYLSRPPEKSRWS